MAGGDSSWCASTTGPPWRRRSNPRRPLRARERPCGVPRVTPTRVTGRSRNHPKAIRAASSACQCRYEHESDADRRPASARPPMTRSRAIDTETKSMPMSAALAGVLQRGSSSTRPASCRSHTSRIIGYLVCLRNGASARTSTSWHFGHLVDDRTRAARRLVAVDGVLAVAQGGERGLSGLHPRSSLAALRARERPRSDESGPRCGGPAVRRRRGCTLSRHRHTADSDIYLYG